MTKNTAVVDGPSGQYLKVNKNSPPVILAVMSVLFDEKSSGIPNLCIVVNWKAGTPNS